MRRGQHHHVPILQGNVEDERSQSGEKAAHDITDEPTYEMHVREAVQQGKFPPSVSADELLQLYPASDYPSPPQAYNSFAEAYNAIFADEMYLCSSREVLKALSTSQDEFVGRFFYTHVYTDGHGVRYGASHGFEVPFIFDTLSSMEFTPTADEAALVKTFQDTWSYFARTGTAPQFWKQYDTQRDNYVIFDTPMSEGVHLHATQCNFWDKKLAESVN
jgi:para-nitrobenzyl esterase